MQELMIFEGHEVEVFELNGRVLFNPKHVAECLEIADVNSSVRNFNKKQLVKVRNSDVHNLHIRKFNNAGKISLRRVVFISWYLKVISPTQKLLQIGLQTKYFQLFARLVPTKCQSNRNRQTASALWI